MENDFLGLPPPRAPAPFHAPPWMDAPELELRGRFYMAHDESPPEIRTASKGHSPQCCPWSETGQCGNVRIRWSPRHLPRWRSLTLTSKARMKGLASVEQECVQITAHPGGCWKNNPFLPKLVNRRGKIKHEGQRLLQSLTFWLWFWGPQAQLPKADDGDRLCLLGHHLLNGSNSPHDFPDESRRGKRKEIKSMFFFTLYRKSVK